MKIIRILFLGIVLVLFNVVYLAAALPDTVFVRSLTAKPGQNLNMTVGIDFNTTAPGGVIAIFNLDSTLSRGLDTVAGAWFAWDTAFGQKLNENATQTLVSFDKPGGVLSVTVFGVNVAQLATFGVINTARKGDLVNFTFRVASTVAEGSYPVRVAEASNIQILPWPITNPLFTDYPVASTQPIVIANIPTYDALQNGPAISAIIGDTIRVPVKVENQDSIGSGSFTLDFPSSQLAFGPPAVAGARGTGMTFTVTTPTAGRLNVAFTGGIIPPGGLGDLVLLPFRVTTGGAAGNITLSSVVLRNPAGTSLAATQQPTAGTVAVGFFYGDSLYVDLQAGNFSAINATQRTVTVPIRLKNSNPVTVVNFSVRPGSSAPAGILTVVSIATTSRTAGWTAVIDSVTGNVVSFAPNAGAAIPAGDGVIFNIVYRIKSPLLTTQLPLDVNMLICCTDIITSTGAQMGVQQINGTVSLDSRVPNDGEGVNPGSTLPKVFALAQNTPNPFNPSTTINYQIPEDAGAGVSFNLNVYDIRGRLVKTLAEGFKGPGSYTAFWDGTNNSGQQTASGVYFYRFTSDRFNSTRKMILIK